MSSLNTYMESLEYYVIQYFNYFYNIYVAFDRKNRFYIIVDIIFEVYRVIMACALVVFVPQTCHGSTGCENNVGEVKTVCSVYANININCLSNYNIFVLFFNLFTALSFLLLYFIEIKREQWIMKHFQKDPEENDNYIEKFYLQYEGLFRKLFNYNTLYNVTYKAITFIYLTNSVLSAVIFYFHYYDITTITNLITNLLLCSRKIYLGLYLSYTSLANNSPTCYYTREFISFNSIDIGVRNIAKYNTYLDSQNGKIRRQSFEIGPFVVVKQMIHSINPNQRNSISTNSNRNSISNTLPRINSIEGFNSIFDNSPKSTNISPRSTNNSPRSTNNSPRSTNNSSRSTNNSPINLSNKTTTRRLSISSKFQIGKDFDIVNYQLENPTVIYKLELPTEELDFVEISMDDDYKRKQSF